MTILHAEQLLTPAGWQADRQITIAADGRIASITGQSQPPDHRIEIALPAPVNLHSHSFQRAMAGLTEYRGPDPQDSFWTWRRLMYRFLDRLTPDHIQAIAEMVFMEMAEAGYGAVAEFHYLHHAPGGQPYDALAETAQRICAAAGATGLGLTLLPVLYQYGGCDQRPLQGGQLRFGNTADGFAALYEATRALVPAQPGDFRLGVAPHSLRAVPPQALEMAEALCPGGPIHMHLAEQIPEVAEVRAHMGARPAEWLLANAPVDARWCLIHCTQMTPAETSALAATGAVAGLCPITESNLGDGIFDGVRYLAQGGRLGVGSDSNVHIALWDELRTLEYSQRLRDNSRAALADDTRSAGRRLYETAAQGGAQAAGRGSGTLAPGEWADILGLRSTPWLCAAEGDRALDALTFGGHGARSVSDLWSAGRHIVTQGCHIARDQILSRFQTVMTELGSDI